MIISSLCRFRPQPRDTLWRYIREVLPGRPNPLGHNPLRGAMVVAPLLSLTGVSVTGLLLNGVDRECRARGGGGASPTEVGCDAAVWVPTAYAADEDERHEAAKQKERRRR